MYDPISVDTALVSSTGDLLISLTDGNIVNAGKVRGERGIQGERGFIGERGEPGTDGVDGAQWHTGVGMPELGLGDPGDLYMDVANSLLPIYQKVGNDWLLLCNLKVPPSGGGGGSGGGAAGGGGSIIIYPKPDGGAPPSTDNDGKPINAGDIWLDTNTGFLWVYNGTNWIPVGDHPPVIVSPTPPLYNGASDSTTQYPIVEGDLWFDSDQLALYVAAKDTGNNLVWVITIPADRSVLLNEVPAGTFVFPASSAGTRANDGDTVFNDTSEIWYIYNGSKNQWIDLPPGETEVSLSVILLRGADNFPDTFEYDAADRVTYGTDALCYVNGDDHPAFTRIVVPFIDSAGFDWRTLLRSITVGDELSLIQIDRGDPDDPNDDFPFRSDYRTVADIVENTESFSLGLSFQQENPNHVPLFGESVAIRFRATVGEDYVKKSGDTMTGELIMDAADIRMENGNIEFHAEGDTAYIQNANNRFGKIISKSPRDTDLNSADFSSEFGIKVDLNEGSTAKNKLKVGNSKGDIITISSGGGPQIVLGGNEFTGSPGQSGLTGGVPILGVPTPSFEDSPGDIAVNKQYVDERDEILQQEIIELEEEIEAIAPSVERGSWAFTLSGIISGPGVFTAFDEYVATSGSPIGLVTNIKSIWFHSIDNSGTPHGFDNVEPGNLLQLFVEGKEEYGLFEVVEVHDFTGGMADYWVIDVDFVRTLENTTRFDNSEICRLNIFKAPEGGNASEFVLKSGDTMSGDLAIDKGAGTDTEAALTLTGSRDNTTNAAATIAFENSQSTTPGYLTYRSLASESFFKFNRDVDLNNNVLRQIGEIRMTPGGYIGSSTNKRLIFNNASDGNEGDGLLVVPRPSVPRRGFVIRGNDDTGTEKDLLFTYTNSSGADAVNYIGKILSKTNLVNKEYVDAAATVSLNCGSGAKWSKGGLNDSTLEGNRFFGIEVAGSTSSAIGSGNVLYLNKLVDSEGVLQRMDQYTPSNDSYCEVYSGNELVFKSQLKPSTYKVADRNPDQIVCDFSSKYPIVAKSGSNWSGSLTYRVILTGMKYTG